MKKTRPIFVLSLLLCIFLAGCGKTDVATSITSGEKIQINAKADCTLEAVLLADEIDLEGLVGYKKDNSRYLLQIWKIKNTGEKTIKMGSLYRGCDVIYQKKQEYKAKFYNDSTGLLDNDKVEPLAERMMYVLTNLPNEVANNLQGLAITVNFDGQNYQIQNSDIFDETPYIASIKKDYSQLNSIITEFTNNLNFRWTSLLSVSPKATVEELLSYRDKKKEDCNKMVQELKGYSPPPLYKNGHEGFLTGIDGMISVFDYILNGKELSLSEFGTLLQKFPQDSLDNAVKGIENCKKGLPFLN